MLITELGRIQTKIVSSLEKEKVGEIRYLSYSKENAIPFSTSKVFLDKYDYYDNCINHIAHSKNGPLGAIRACIYKRNSDDILPSFEIFHKEIDIEIGFTKNIFESCRFVVLPNVKKSFHANLALIKTNCISSYVMNCDHTITAVREKHVEFYKKIGFYKCSDSKLYPGLKIKMVLLMAKDSKRQIENLHKNFKLLSHTLEDRENYIKCLKETH